MPRFIFVSVLLLSSTIALAGVDSVSGVITQGDLVTLSGSGFGTQDPSKITWDDFEDGAVNTLATSGTWATVNLLRASTASRNPFSHYAATHDFTAGGTAGVQANNITLSVKWFVQYWVKLDSFDWGTGTYGSTSQHLSNIKFLRFWNPGSEQENFYTQFWWSLTGNAYSNIEYITQTVTTKNYATPLHKSMVSDGAWHLFQFEFADSSEPGAADGVFKMWFDGKLMEHRTGFIGRTNSNLKRPNLIGFYNAWGPNTTGGELTRAPNTFTMDDVYASPTFARVEIGDRAVYGECTHREIQPVQSWSDTQIQIKVNQGSFAPGASAFVFVLDENGVAGAGKPVTFFGTSLKPAAPEALRAF